MLIILKIYTYNLFVFVFFVYVSENYWILKEVMNFVYWLQQMFFFYLIIEYLLNFIWKYKKEKKNVHQSSLPWYGVVCLSLLNMKKKYCHKNTPKQFLKYKRIKREFIKYWYLLSLPPSRMLTSAAATTPTPYTVALSGWFSAASLFTTRLLMWVSGVFKWLLRMMLSISLLFNDRRVLH